MKAIPKISHTTSMSHPRGKEKANGRTPHHQHFPSFSAQSENKCRVEARNLQESNKKYLKMFCKQIC